MEVCGCAPSYNPDQRTLARAQPDSLHLLAEKPMSAAKLIRVLLPYAVVSVLSIAVGIRFSYQFRLLSAAAYGLLDRQACGPGEALKTYFRYRNAPDYRETFKKTMVLAEGAEDGLRLLKTAYGPFWISPKDTTLDDVSYMLGEQKVDIYGQGGHGVRSGDVVLDCGANIGIYTRTALNRGARLVVAIEPVPAFVAGLRKTFASEIQAGRVIIYPKGVWDEEKQLEMSMGFESGWGDSFVLDRGDIEKSRLPVTRIDLLVPELKLDRVDYIKMDIEGAEFNALLGAAETIRKFRPRMAISTYHLTEDYRRLPNLIRKYVPEYSTERCECRLSEGQLRASPGLVMFYR